MTWMSRRSSFLLLAGAMLLSALPAEATVVVMHSIEEMSRRSEVIVHAKVLDTQSTKENARIITLTRLEVIDGLKGAKAGDVLTIYQVGGTVGEQRAMVVGAHEYTRGEELVWFGVRHGERVVSYGVGLGKFRVVYDGAFQRIVEELGDVAVMSRDEAGKAVFSSPEPRNSDSLAGFKQQVRDALAQGSLPRSRVFEKKTQKPVRFEDALRVKR